MRARIFISHKSQNIEFTTMLANALKAHGHQPLYSGDEIQLGTSWRQELTRQLISADILLPLMTPEGVGFAIHPWGDWCRPRASPHFSYRSYCGRRSSRHGATYSRLPIRHRVTMPSPSNSPCAAPRRDLDALATDSMRNAG